MNYKKLFGLSIGAMVLATCIVSNDVEASNLDTYRNLLKKQTYTIRYVDVTPEQRVTNRDKVPMHGKSVMDKSQSHFLTNKQVEYLIVANGADRYEEMGSGEYKQCRLIKGKDTYNFVKHNNGKTTDVWGSKKGIVTAVETNSLAAIMSGISFGGSNMTRYLNAILPNDDKSKDMPIFRFVDSGWLNNGLNYEDYTSTNNGIFEAVRYYFNGYNLVKIAAVQYWTNANGVMEGNKTIMKISEFSPTPEKTYLELPAGVKDKTKRKKDKGGK